MKKEKWLYEKSQGKTWEMFIITANINPYTHSVCCCYVCKVLSYMMESDKFPLTKWGFHIQFAGEKWEKGKQDWCARAVTELVFFFPTLSAEATNKQSIAKINTAVTVTSCLIQECSLQTLSKSLHDSNLSWTIHCKKIICVILFVDLKPSLPGTVIRYFHHNRYIFLNSYASLKMTWNWN